MRRAEKLRATSVSQIYRSCKLPVCSDGEHSVNIEVNVSTVDVIVQRSITDTLHGLPTEVAVSRPVLDCCPWLDNVILPAAGKLNRLWYVPGGTLPSRGRISEK